MMPQVICGREDFRQYDYCMPLYRHLQGPSQVHSFVDIVTLKRLFPYYKVFQQGGCTLRPISEPSLLPLHLVGVHPFGGIAVWVTSNSTRG